MGTGYTRNDTVNNIADGNVINASDLDGEFDALQSAFDASTGHTHDGTTAEGAPIEVTGPAQEYVSTNSEFRPKANNTYDLGSASNQWKDLYVDGTANLDTVDIDAGNIDGTTIGGTTPAAGTFTTLSATGNVTLGNAATDTVTITADVASNVIPSVDNTYDLGAVGSEWKDLYIDGTANIDSLVADTADINGGTIDGTTIGGASAAAGTFTNVTATGTVNLSGATVSNGGSVTTVDINGGTIDGVTIGGASAGAGTFTTLTATGNVTLGDAATDTVTITADVASSLIPSADDTYDLGAVGSEWRNLYIDGTANIDALAADAATISGNLTVNGNTTLGNAATDTVTITADVASNIIPSADNTYDLGASGSEWKDLYINGTANIDSLVADTADINGGTIDGVTIGGASAGAGTFTTLTVTGNVTLGDAATDTVTVTADVASSLIPSADDTYDLGAVGSEWRNLYIDGTANIDVLSAGATTVTGDLNIADKIVHTGDTNTAIRFPAADTVTVETAGTERVRFDSSGNVGIGTSSPLAKTNSVSAGAALGGTAQFAIGSGTNNFENTYFRIDDSGNSNFCIDQIVGGTSFNRLFIERTTGNVGIGTSSPAFTSGSGLEVQRAADATVRVERTDATASAGEFVASSGLVKIGSTGGVPFTFITDNTERMRIDSSGNVGIGTSSPAGDYKLDVNGAFTVGGTYNTSTSTNGGGVNIGFDTTNGGKIESLDPGISWYPLVVGASEIKFATNGGERSRIDASGNLIVGGTTALQSAKVSVHSGSVAVEHAGVDGTYLNSFVAVYSTNNNEHNAIRTAVSGNGALSGFQFMVSDGGGSSGTTESFRINRTSCTVIGSLSKGSGSFKIDHPLKPETHHLVHSFVEGPQADNLYRGKVALVNGAATVNLDEAARMTEGTFVALNGNVQCFTTNEDGWTAVRGKVEGNILTIEAQDAACTDTVSWLVIGERHDQHMIDTDWTDEQGRVITEPAKEIAE